MASEAILGCMMSSAVTLLFLRMYLFAYISQEMSLVIAVASVFITTTESAIEEQIQNPGSIVQISTIFKILKSILTMMVLTYNGNINDYFIILFFFYTTFIGTHFFQHAGLHIPYKAFYQEELPY